MQFKTKARAVDLLGKGQIADLPTAITELWKNGYDAYADILEASLYKSGYYCLQNNYFSIYDDGKGMSRNDIIEKWLVLGTDSKSRIDLDVESEETLWKKPRVKTGEKGIGRLSVAYLGNQMLMITKKNGNPIQILYLDWRILENYNLFLEDIIVPIREINDINELDFTFQILKTEFLLNLTNDVDSKNKIIWEDSQIDLKDKIFQETIYNDIENPIIESINDKFGSDNSHGTLFIIFNPISHIIALSEKDDDNINDLTLVTTSLIGFTNPFKYDKPKIEIKFNVFQNESNYDLLQTSGEFFKCSDFKLADVYIKGLLDGNGNFNGIIRLYDNIIEYSYTNPRKKDKRTIYGTVPIELGYLLGEKETTKLPELQFDKFSKKIKEYGGLYIFRDDFRVLPYGRENADFLNFELRRSKRAGTYFFSYRRMFGYLELSRKINPDLKDKSSREGLINNAQYRAFTNDLSSLFITIAYEYFATDAKNSIFRDELERQKEQYKVLNADKERERIEKISFTKSLNSYSEKLNSHKSKYDDILIELESQLNDPLVSYSNIEVLLDKLHILDVERGSILPKIPKRYKPTERQLEQFYKFEEAFNIFINEHKNKRDNINTKALEKLEIRDLKIDMSKKYNTYINSLNKTLNELKIKLNNKFNILSNDFELKSKNILEVLTNDKKNRITNITTKEDVNASNASIELIFNNLTEEINKTLHPLVEHINRITFEIDEELVQGAYKEQFDKMKYQWEQTRDTAQLGIAVEIIDHEFNQLYAKINTQIGIIGSNQIANSIKEFRLLEKNFKQLEDKYTLLSPLYRISGAITKEIRCEKIYNYLLDFFENPIKQYGIEINVSESFLNLTLTIKEPIIHTVFINIINNAIYWMRNSTQRTIVLDYYEETLEVVIANSGEKIPDYKLDKIFDLFYTQRPGGRGIGLYLSKQSLTESGLDIYATNDKIYNTMNGACFVITLNEITR